MTTDPSPTETKSRRFTALDCVVFALAVGSFAAPFAVHMQVEAQASTPQIAVRADVSPIRPIDIAMGYKEERAEAAFFEGLGEEYKSSADVALDVALAEPETLPEGNDPALKQVDEKSTARTDASGSDSPTESIKPTPSVDIAQMHPPLLLDIAIAADVSDEPPVSAPSPEPEVVEDSGEPAPQIKVMMTAPPTMTPFPIKRPFHAVTTPIETVTLAAASRVQLPIDVTPPIETVALATPRVQVPIDVTPSPPSFIEEAPLAPLDVATRPIIEETPIAPIIGPVEIVETPIPVTPVAPVLPVAPAVPVEPVVSLDPVVPVETIVAVAQPITPTPARAGPRIRNGPRIALVITAAGLNENVTKFAIEALPAGVTLAFAPVKPEAAALAREAKADGHMVLVEIPLEPLNKNRDPGSMTLRVAASPDQNREKLNNALARIPVADGASTYLGTRFNTDERAVGSMVSALAARNLFLFENEPSSRSVFQRISARAKLPYARSILKIDRDQNSVKIRAALNELEKQARERGVAVGVGTAFRGTISTVALWAKQAEKRGVRLVPVIQVAR